MNKLLPLLVLLGFWTACAKDQGTPELDKASKEARADSLLQRMTPNPNPAELAELRGLYEEMRLDTSYPMTDRLNMERFLAEADYSEGKYALAYNRLQQAIHDLPKAATIPEASLLWAELAIRHLKRPAVAEMIFAQLREKYPEHNTLKVIPADYAEIPVEDLRKQMQGRIYPGGNELNREAGLSYSDASYAYSAFERDPTLAAQDHLAIAQVLQQMHTYDLAIQHLDFIVKQYPETSQASDGMLLKAYILGIEQESAEDARAVLETLEKSYPASAAAKEADALRNQLK